MKVNKDRSGFSAIAAVAVINGLGKVMGVITRDMSIKSPDLTKFFMLIAKRLEGQRVMLYLDNLKAHHNKHVVEAAIDKGMDIVYAPIYSP